MKESKRLKRRWDIRKRWTDDEVRVIVDTYERGEWGTIMAALPGRSRSMIHGKAYSMGIVRHRPQRRTAAQVREAKRLAMRESRMKNPQRMRDVVRAWYARNRSAVHARNRNWARVHFFRNRAARRCGATARELFDLWRRQRGRCALSGRVLDRTAHLDHVTPRTRGGADDISNYRWLAPEINLMKRDLTDEEFVALCRNCMEWIGERIAMVDARMSAGGGR